MAERFPGKRLNSSYFESPTNKNKEFHTLALGLTVVKRGTKSEILKQKPKDNEIVKVLRENKGQTTVVFLVK